MTIDEVKMSKKKSYDADFKARVALEAIRGDLTINEISTKYKIHSTQITRWKQEAISSIKTSFSGKQQKAQQSDQQLMDELYKQIGQLKCENDFLKKSVWE